MLDASLLDSLRTAILLLNEEERIISLNVAAQQLFNIGHQRATNNSFGDLFFDQKNYSYIGQVINTAKVNQAPFTQHYIKTKLHEKSEHTFDLSVTPIEDNFLIEINSADRIAKIQTEKQLYSSQASTKNLIRNLAHEIKNPLAGLRGAAQLLDMEIDDIQLKDYTDVIIAETNRLTEVVDNLLLPYRESKFSLLNIHEVTERISKLLETEVKTQLSDNTGSIVIKKHYDPSIPDLIADKTQLIQALLNIASNALRAAQHYATSENKQGIITIRTSIQRKFTIDSICHKLVCQIDIEDNGFGIDETLHDTLFFPMISGEQQGTGLGLPIAQSIIHHHQGLITFNSNPGKTCFSIYLPIKSDEFS